MKKRKFYCFIYKKYEIYFKFKYRYEKDITIEDLTLLCDLFYLPFEHGSKGIQILNEFYWLKSNAIILVSQKKHLDISSAKPEVQEWFRRSEKFSKLCQAVYILTKKIALIPNKEICYDLYSYVWDISAVISLMNAFIKWLCKYFKFKTFFFQ